MFLAQLPIWYTSISFFFGRTLSAVQDPFAHPNLADLPMDGGRLYTHLDYGTEVVGIFQSVHGHSQY